MLTTESRRDLRQKAQRAWEDARRLNPPAGPRPRPQTTQAAEVDRLIAEHQRFGAPAGQRPGVGLVVADRPDRIGFLHDALHLQLGQVWTAGDAPSATAVAITEQPDIAVIDDELVGCSGFDMALTIRDYSPATSVVLIIDEQLDTEVAPAAVAGGAVTSMRGLGQTIERLL